MAIDVLWIRVGDSDDYHALDDLDAVADLLAEVGIGQVERYCLFGVCTAGFEGHNYISLYWGPDPGDGSAEASRELTDGELIELREELHRRQRRQSQILD
jgi:hypothetical protein